MSKPFWIASAVALAVARKAARDVADDRDDR